MLVEITNAEAEGPLERFPVAAREVDDSAGDRNRQLEQLLVINRISERPPDLCLDVSCAKIVPDTKEQLGD
jgi:hypothetical protein